MYAKEELRGTKRFVMTSKEISKALGIGPAILLHTIDDFMQIFEKAEAGVAEPKHYRDGRWWVWNSYKAWEDNIEVLDFETIRRYAQWLEELGILITSQEYNRLPFDRTKWYSIDYDMLDIFLEDWRKCGMPRRTICGKQSDERQQFEDHWATDVLYRTDDPNESRWPDDGVTVTHFNESPSPEDGVTVTPSNEGIVTPPIPENTENQSENSEKAAPDAPVDEDDAGTSDRPGGMNESTAKAKTRRGKRSPYNQSGATKPVAAKGKAALNMDEPEDPLMKREMYKWLHGKHVTLGGKRKIYDDEKAFMQKVQWDGKTLLDLYETQRFFDAWVRTVYGWMSQYPDFKLMNYLKYLAKFDQWERYYDSVDVNRIEVTDEEREAAIRAGQDLSNPKSVASWLKQHEEKEAEWAKYPETPPTPRRKTWGGLRNTIDFIWHREVIEVCIWVEDYDGVEAVPEPQFDDEGFAIVDDLYAAQEGRSGPFAEVFRRYEEIINA